MCVLGVCVCGELEGIPGQDSPAQLQTHLPTGCYGFHLTLGTGPCARAEGVRSATLGPSSLGSVSPQEVAGTELCNTHLRGG